MFEETLMPTLASFNSHGLEDLKAASLMERVDTKYVFDLSLLLQLLPDLNKKYSILEVCATRLCRYESVYFDTSGLLFYGMHQRGQSNRLKVRVRNYIESNIRFLEVKIKSNKGRTTKLRRQLQQGECVDSEASCRFLTECGVPYVSILQPCHTTGYQRIALANEDQCERITFDINLTNRFLRDNSTNTVHLPQMVVAEVKQQKINRTTPVQRALRDLGVRASRYSKYCMGIVLTSPQQLPIKTNRFKRIERKISHFQSISN